MTASDLSGNIALRLADSYPFVVVGGGLGGLVLARVLQRRGFDVAVFERETARDSRGQGGVLDMHADSGQWALIQAGLEAEFRAMVIAGGEDMRILDRHGEILWDEVTPPDVTSRPEVDRPALRDMLIHSLEPGTIHWDHQLVSMTQAGARGTHLLTFASGDAVTASVVIGADGANSCVRPRLTDARPTYTGVSFIELSIPEVDQHYPEIARTVGRGSLFALGDNKGILAHRNGDGRVCVYIALRMEEGTFASLGIAFSNPTNTRAGIAAQFEDWAPALVNLIRACDNTFMPRAVNAMPVGVTWPSRGNITLLGDAAHLMSPFAGEGANLAMQDGAELALHLIEANDPAIAITAYEAKMFARAKAAAQDSAEGLATCMAPDGAARLAKMMQGFRQT